MGKQKKKILNFICSQVQVLQFKFFAFWCPLNMSYVDNRGHVPGIFIGYLFSNIQLNTCTNWAFNRLLPVCLESLEVIWVPQLHLGLGHKIYEAT